MTIRASDRNRDEEPGPWRMVVTFGKVKGVHYPGPGSLIVGDASKDMVGVRKVRRQALAGISQMEMTVGLNGD